MLRPARIAICRSIPYSLLVVLAAHGTFFSLFGFFLFSALTATLCVLIKTRLMSLWSFERRRELPR